MMNPLSATPHGDEQKLRIAATALVARQTEVGVV